MAAYVPSTMSSMECLSRSCTTLKKIRKYANHKSGAPKGSVEMFSRRIYIHIYFSLARHNASKADFEATLYEIKMLLEKGTPLKELSSAAQAAAKKYFILKKRGSKVIVVPKNKEIQEANKYHGYFVLVSNKEKDPFECLKKYRKRETIESFFEAEKQHADGSRVRVWNSDTLRGRMFVQFVSLCYYEYYSEEIRRIKKELDAEVDRGEANSQEMKIIRKLRTWVYNTPLYLQLQWFDTIENVEISTKLHNRRWNTEMTSCDALYLKMLGMNEA